MDLLAFVFIQTGRINKGNVNNRNVNMSCVNKKDKSY